jgi:chromate transporter
MDGRRECSTVSARAPDAPSLTTLFFAYLRLGSVSFGGPAMVAYIGDLATRRGWLSKDDFKVGVALCQAIPGATAMQSAAYVGFRVRGLAGAVATYAGFGLPAFLLMTALSMAYRHAIDLDVVTSALTGLRALVVALVANAAWSFGRSTVKHWTEAVLAAATGLLFFAGVSPFLIVAGAGIVGAALLRGRVQTVVSADVAGSGRRAFRAPAIVLAAAAATVIALWLMDPLLARVALIMMKVDVFAFGGGFASLPLMLTEFVRVREWVPAEVFLDGVALGQVTPGPIVITATFVGYQVAGLPGAVAATLGIFLPSIFVVVLAEPWFRRLQSSAVFQAASHAFILSFVGLLVSVAVQFARVATWSVPAVLLAVAAFVALRLKVDFLWVVLAGAVLSALLL